MPDGCDMFELSALKMVLISWQLGMHSTRTTLIHRAREDIYVLRSKGHAPHRITSYSRREREREGEKCMQYRSHSRGTQIY